MLIMTFSDLPFPLAQSTEFEVGEILGINTSVNEDDTSYDSNHTFIEVHNFNVTIEGRLYVDVEVTVTTNPDLVVNISPDPLDTLHASPLGSPLCPSSECHNLSLVGYHAMLEGKEVDCIEFLGTSRGYDPFLDPYSLYLRNMSAKIILTTTFDHLKDFSKAFDKFKRALTIVSEFVFKCSYSHSFELYA